MQIQATALVHTSVKDMRQSYAAARKRLQGQRWENTAPPVIELPAPIELKPVEMQPVEMQPEPQAHKSAYSVVVSTTFNPLIVPMISIIKFAVASSFGIRPSDMESPCRRHKFLIPRQIAIALCRRLSGKSTTQIGRAFGNRDHSTIIHACRRFSPIIAAVAPSMSDISTVDEWIREIRKLLASMK